MTEESTFKQLAQKLADGRHEVVGLFEPEQAGGTWLETNKEGVVAVAVMAVPILLCAFFYFSNEDKNKIEDSKNEMKIKQEDD